MLKKTLPAYILALSLGVCATGCFSVSSYHTARPIKTGKTEIMVAVAGYGAVESDGSGVSYSSPRLNVRRGLSSKSDFGLTAGEFGLGFDYNHLLVDESTFALSIDPYIGVLTQGVFGSDANTLDTNRNSTALTLYLGFLGDIVNAPGVTVTLGAKAGLLAQLNDGGDNSAFIAGSAAIKFHAGSIALLPEITLIYPLDDNKAIWTAGVGVGF